jgi:hypothetical protein
MTLTYFTSNWKSSLQSILTVTLAVTGYLMTASIIHPKTAAILGTINGIAKVVLGIFQSDGIQIPSGSTVKQTTSVTTK